MTTTRAAIVTGAGVPPEIGEVILASLAPGEVQLAVSRAGVCHTDLGWADSGAVFPVVLGHECAGIVTDVGPGVTAVQPGDRVVVASTSHCGHCAACERGEQVFCSSRWDSRPRLIWGGQDVAQASNIGAFAAATIVRDRALFKLPEDVPFDVAAVAGCAVVTGIGAVLNVARVPVGATVAVIGCGGIGACAILGAIVAGAERVVVADPNPERRQLALELGATDACEPSADALRELVPAGFDFAFEAVGRAEAMRMAVQVIRPGGTAVLMGVTGEALSIDAGDLVVNQKTVKGCQMGNFRPAVDFDRYFRLHRRGRLNLGALISATLPLEEVASAFDRARRGEGIRTLLSMD